METQFIFIIIWLTLAATMLTITYKRGKKALEIFPSLESVNVVFREKGVSGHSRKSWKSKLGGAKNVLDIIVTNEELWIRGPILSVGFGHRNSDLIHKVKLADVQVIEIANKEVTISLKSTDNLETTLDLRIKKTQEFVDKIAYVKILEHNN